MDSGDTSGQPAANPEAKQGEERKNKWPREQNKGQKVGKGNTYRSGRQSWDSWQSSGSFSDTQALQKEIEYRKDNMTLMARSILRHEDELSQQRTEREFLLTVEQGSAGLLPIMYRQSMEWKKLKDSTGVSGPLRLHLFNSMMQSWKQRVETVHSRACQGWGPAHGYSEGGASGKPVVELPQVGLGQGPLGGGREGAAYAYAGHGAPEQHPAELRGPGRHFEVPDHQAFGGAASDTRHLPPLDWDAGAQMPYPLSGDDGNVRQRLVESHQHESQAGEDGKATFAQNLGREVSSQGMGGGGQKEGRRHRLRASAPVMVLRPTGTVLTNPHNICYANSVFQFMIWMAQTSGLKPDFSYGALCLAFQQIPLHRRVYVPDIPHWSRVLRRWPHLNRQQDYVEFLMFVLREARPSAYTGSWQARMLMPQHGTNCVSIVDRGSAFSILALDVQSGTLQQQVDNWSSQYAVHALQVPCQLIMLHLKRYAQTSAGVTKDVSCIPVKADELLQVPVFGSQLQRTYYTYQVVAMIFHTGSSLNSGHYQAALSAGESHFGSKREAWFITDDGQPYHAASAAELEHMSCNSYVIGLRLLPNSRWMSGCCE